MLVRNAVAAQHVHPRVVERLYHEKQERVRHWSEPEGPTVAQFREQDPGMPEEALISSPGE